MLEVIENLRKLGKWYIVPDGEWLTSLLLNAQGICACGHHLERSYFAALVVDGEVIETMEFGQVCIRELTNGYFYKTPYSGEWIVLSDDEVWSLFCKGFMVREYRVKDGLTMKYVDEKGGRFPPRFVISVYNFAMSQREKTGLPRVTEKQYATIQDILSK